MVVPKVVEIFLAEGDASGLQIVNIKNRKGQALVSTRSNYKTLLQRPESENPCIYLLIGKDDPTGLPMIYVGETENFRTRVKNHLSKDFWNKIFLFTSTEFNQAMVKYLESSVHNELVETENVILENKNLPLLPKLSEADIAVMTEYKNNLILTLGVVGYPDITKKVSRVEDTSQTKNSMGDYLFHWISSKYSVTASMRPTTTGFLVLKGSELRPQKENDLNYPHGRAVQQLRDDLIENGDLEVEEAKLVLRRDILFDSPSGASNFVVGYHTNGRSTWKTEDGKTFAEIEEGLLS